MRCTGIKVEAKLSGTGHPIGGDAFAARAAAKTKSGGGTAGVLAKAVRINNRGTRRRAHYQERSRPPFRPSFTLPLALRLAVLVLPSR